MEALSDHYDFDARLPFMQPTQQSEQRVCIDKAGGPGMHLLNLGHGVMQGTSEIAGMWLGIPSHHEVMSDWQQRFENQHQGMRRIAGQR